MLLITEVGRHPQPIATVIQAKGKQLGALVFVIDGGVAFALCQVHAHPELVFSAKALAQIQMLADAPVVGYIGGETACRRVLSAFGLQVDATANP